MLALKKDELDILLVKISEIEEKFSLMKEMNEDLKNL